MRPIPPLNVRGRGLMQGYVTGWSPLAIAVATAVTSDECAKSPASVWAPARWGRGSCPSTATVLRGP